MITSAKRSSSTHKLYSDPSTVTPYPIPQPRSCFTNTLIIVGIITSIWIIVASIAYCDNNITIRNVAIAGVCLGIIGTGAYFIQRRAYNNGSRGAQKNIT